MFDLDRGDRAREPVRVSSPTPACASAARRARWRARSGTPSPTRAGPHRDVLRQHRRPRRGHLAARGVHRATQATRRPAGHRLGGRHRRPGDAHVQRRRRRRPVRVPLAHGLGRVQALHPRRLPRRVPDRRPVPHRVRHGRGAGGHLQRLRLLRARLPVRRDRPARGRRPRVEVHALLRPPGRRAGTGLRQGLPDRLHPVRRPRRATRSAPTPDWRSCTTPASTTPGSTAATRTTGSAATARSSCCSTSPRCTACHPTRSSPPATCRPCGGAPASPRSPCSAAWRPRSSGGTDDGHPRRRYGTTGTHRGDRPPAPSGPGPGRTAHGAGRGVPVLLRQTRTQQADLARPRHRGLPVPRRSRRRVLGAGGRRAAHRPRRPRAGLQDRRARRRSRARCTRWSTTSASRPGSSTCCGWSNRPHR